ncbi:MAG: hypothetical protein ACP5NE_01590 [Candidatus Micrarchaeia archaeon]
MRVQTKEPRCIICGLEKEGLPVKNDYIIESIRFFKKNVTKNEKGYRLVVCRECFPKYASLRRRFERRRAIYIAIGVLFAAMFLVLSPDKLTALVYGVIIVLFLYLLSLVNYIPSLELPRKDEKASTAKRNGAESPTSKIAGASRHESSK